MSERQPRKKKQPCAPRAPPMSALESDILMHHINERKDILECTATDVGTKALKTDAWLTVAEEYAKSAANMKINIPRSVEQLKLYWKNSKAKVRKIDSEIKQDQLATGGGAGKPIDPQMEILSGRVRSIVPTINFTLENKWDSTSTFERSRSDESDSEMLQCSEDVNGNEVSDYDLSALDDEEPTQQFKTDDLYDQNDNMVVYQEQVPEEEVINLVDDQNNDALVPRRNLQALRVSEPVIDLALEDDGNESRTRKYSKVSPAVQSKVINPANIIKARAPQFQQKLDVSINKPATIKKRPGRVDEKLKRSLKYFEERQRLESAEQNISNRTRPSATITSSDNESNCVKSEIDSKPIERSPLKSLPQPEAVPYSTLCNTRKTSQMRRNYVPIKIKNELQHQSSGEPGPLQQRLRNCQENFRPISSSIPKRAKAQNFAYSKMNWRNDEEVDQAKFKEEIFREKMSAIQLENSFWKIKCEGANAEKEFQIISKQAAEMKLRYYRSKCGLADGDSEAADQEQADRGNAAGVEDGARGAVETDDKIQVDDETDDKIQVDEE